jgi:hypothetical protein
MTQIGIEEYHVSACGNTMRIETASNRIKPHQVRVPSYRPRGHD